MCWRIAICSFKTKRRANENAFMNMNLSEEMIFSRFFGIYLHHTDNGYVCTYMRDADNRKVHVAMNTKGHLKIAKRDIIDTFHQELTVRLPM